jgi:ribosomal protein S8
MELESEVDKFMKNIREFLNRLSVGYKCRSTHIKINLSVENSKIVNFFYEKGWIKLYVIQNDKIIVYLRYINNNPLFTKIKFVSTPGHRKFFSKESLSFYKKNNSGHANILLHTTYGLLTLKSVENLSIGGEVSYILYN